MSVYDGYNIQTWKLPNGTGQISSVYYYYLRAQDSGLAFPGYVYWYSYNLDYFNAPTPSGVYSDLIIINKIRIDSIIE
jgi:hypothetical protein